MDEELKIARLDHSIVIGALGGNDHDIDELCLQLMERLIERRGLEARGETHLQARGKGTSDALVNHLIISIMEALQAFSLEPKPSFVVLVRELLGGADSDILQGPQEMGRPKSRGFLGMQLKRRADQQFVK